MERIVIIGCGGAGKSTLARELGEKLGLPAVHLDKLFWRPGWQPVSQEEFDEALAREVSKPRWILDGNFNRTIRTRLEKCDTVIYLDYSRLACLLGVAKRILTTFGKVRPDMGEGCPERLDWEFLCWVWNYNRTKRPGNYALLSQYPHKNVLIFKNRRELRKFLESLGDK